MKVSPTGPLHCLMALIGEAPGAEEEQIGVPFVGASGQELTRMLSEAGIERKHCYLTNLFDTRPATLRAEAEGPFFDSLGNPNSLDHLSANKKECLSYAPDYQLPPLSSGKYLHPRYVIPALGRLQREVSGVQTNLLVALGGTALWALTGHAQITKFRGYTTTSTLLPVRKVLPTFHPAAILRSWEDRVVMVMDLLKGKRESAFPEIRRPERRIWLLPTIPDLIDFERHIQRGWDEGCLLSFDIENPRGFIDCISLAPRTDLSLVVPFYDPRREGKSYWTEEEERFVVRWLKRILETPKPKVGQNGLFDIQVLLSEWGIRVRGYQEDTMIAHHALYPELQKSLGFMGSVWTDEIAWKQLNPRRGRMKMEKRDE